MLLLLLGCTLSPGQGFGEIAGGTLDAALVPGPARDLGDHTLLTDQGFAVRVDAFTLALGAVRVEALEGGTAAEFDPANPPEGYSLCHGGHCHAADGSLVSYADIAAELAGADAEWVALATLPVDAEADLRAGATFTLLPDDPAPLPRGEATRLALTATRVHLEGEAGDDAGLAAPLSVDLDLPAGFDAGIELPFDRGYDPVVTLDVSLAVDGTLFDDLDLAALAAADGAVTLDDPADPAADAFLTRLGATEPVVTLTRTP